jgi:hypothetical protein
MENCKFNSKITTMPNFKKSLAETHPDLAKEWHPDKNENLTPEGFTAGSHKKIVWKCREGNDHIWTASINKRALRDQGCPACSGHKVVPSNCLATTHPDIAEEWHPNKNGDLSPEGFTAGSHKKIVWKCAEEDDHIWTASIKKRALRKQGCPACSGHMAVPSNCLATTHPDIAEEWHPNKNGDLSPEGFTAGSHKKIVWKCREGNDHIWTASINKRALRDQGCPACSGHKVVPSNCLATTHPKLANQWHPDKNENLTPEGFTAGSKKKVWWECKTGRLDHIWLATIQKRAKYNQGCPYCTLTPQSRQELIITFELKTLFQRIDPKGYKARLDGRLRAIDIFIPQLNLCIEFDGSYWHKDKRAIDKIKSNLLQKEGYSVIRVREEPLKKIHDTNVISKQPYNGKQVTNDILSMILSMYDLDSELVQRIKGYQSKGELQNERGLNRYIDKILKEKAEKK